jgi:adenylate cyclase
MTTPAALLQRWLLTDGRAAASVPDLLEQVSLALRRHAPVDRMWVGTKVLHPQAAAYLWIHEQGRPLVAGELSYAVFARMRQGDSPARRLERGAPVVCFQPGDADLPEDTADLWPRGYTELYGLSLFLRGRWAGAVTWSTQSPGGFSVAHRGLFDDIMPALSAVIEPLAQELVMGTLLRTYLGQDAGDRVHSGAVKRGDGTTMRAVVWFSDVRGFTRLSTELERDALLDLLNDHFEAVVQAVEAQGGQVLKFMGDGLLAVFPETPGDPSGGDVCRAARGAAEDLQVRLRALRIRREAEGLEAADIGVGLHFGEVSYGNIGAPARLDFTVIGPAVNLAARVEAMCGKLGEGALATADFVRRDGGTWESRGEHAMKGVALPVEVFAPGS